MKKVFALLAVASMVSFAACNNAAKVEEETVVEETFAIDEDGDEVDFEEVEATPAK